MPKSRGRKKASKKVHSDRSRGRRSAVSRLDATYREVLAGLDQIARGGDPLDAEVLISMLAGDGWQSDETSAEHTPLEALLDAAERRTARPGAVALARAASSMAPTADLAARARDVADDLVARGAPEPSWSTMLDQVAAGDCWALRDVYGDGASVLCSFERAGRRHGLSVLVDFNHLGGWAKDILLAEDVDAMLELMHEGASDASQTMYLEQIGPGEARHLLESAFAATDSTWQPEVSDEFVELRALALSRLKVLPESPDPTIRAEPGDGERAGIVQEFLASPEAADLPSVGDPEYCARLIVDYGADYDDGKLLRVSPAKTEIFMLGWVPRKVLLDPGDRALLPELMRAWVRWSARRQGLPPAAVDELHEAARICAEEFDSAYDDADDSSQASALLSGLPETESVAELQDALDRRRFAMPYFGTRIGEEDFPRLDPNDPDERSILIQGEHPEYHEALADPAFEGEIDGVNPRLHLAIHEIVANQLWDNDPPEVWAAAHRLLAAGYDRHDILHTIGHAVMTHLHTALTDHEPVDVTAYRAELDNLGR
ncbi:DUF1841 family protein [Kribbella sp. NPDC050124]|uniref:DUF1841 family protein n=1 Tax=Kribbella sp. NPDC050124 TaxID=3364114 RepID=UPI0037AAC87C